MRCMSTRNLLAEVVAELARREGQMRRIAHESGLAYDTVLRIKNGEGEPGYLKVQQLHDYLFAARKASA